MLRTKKSSSSNMRFLFGSVVFFAVVILSIMLFVYYAMRESWKKSPDARFSYTITFSQSFKGGDYQVFMDDSLLYAGNPFNADTVLRVERYTVEEPVTVAGVDTVVVVPHFTSTSSVFVVDGRTGIPVIVNVGENSRIHFSHSSGRVVACFGN